VRYLVNSAIYLELVDWQSVKEFVCHNSCPRSLFASKYPLFPVSIKSLGHISLPGLGWISSMCEYHLTLSPFTLCALTKPPSAHLATSSVHVKEVCGKLAARRNTSHCNSRIRALFSTKWIVHMFPKKEGKDACDYPSQWISDAWNEPK
jgi:hypothetical protein